MSRTSSPYTNLYERLVANTAEPINSNACWPWTARTGRGGYGRVDIYVPGLGRNVTLQAHIALFVLTEASPVSVDEFYLAYLELAASGLELDHLCNFTDCIYPGHMEPVTPKVNCVRREERRRGWTSW